MKFVFRISGAWNFDILIHDSDTGSPSSVDVRIESLITILFQFQYVNFVWKTMRGRQKPLLNEGDEGQVVYMEKKWRKIMTHLKFHH